MVKIIFRGLKKRQEPPETLEGPSQKRQKMDTSIKIECRKILRTLRTHKYSYVFNQPVDPIDLGIPDYFEIISHPMDLGTINKKLEDDAYSFSEAFAADVRLTFSNAMKYNPPNNFVHTVAKELNNLFDRSWKSLETEMVKQSKRAQEQRTSRKNLPTTNTIRKTVEKQGTRVSLKPKKTEDTSIPTYSEDKHTPLVSREEKARLKKELMFALTGDLSGPLRGFLRKYNLVSSQKEKIESLFSSFGDDMLLELKRVMKEKGNGSHVKTQQRSGITERPKAEEKSNLEARIRAARAAKEAILESAKTDLQMKRDQERERVEKMKRTVVMDDNLTVLMELEKLCQYSGIKNPLEKLGLRLKEEYYYGYEYIDFDELEDGEIF